MTNFSAVGRRKERLDSWKEISAFLNRGVRTVQRWESEENLPVHRHNHQKRDTVFAFASEIEQWMRSRDGRKALSASSNETELAEQCVTARLRGQHARQLLETVYAKQSRQIEAIIANLKRTLA
jgi:phage terminase Nu1 subunit (DNA packaging protein)